MTAFEEMGVLPEIAKAVDEMEWTLPTDVQAEAIPLILGGGDVLMAAETGSGKTGAFCLPVLQIVWETLKDIQTGKGRQRANGSGKHEFKEWLLNMYDRSDAMAITPEGILCQARDQQAWHGYRCTKGVVGKGKYYFEATVTDEGLCRVGWSAASAALDLGTDKFGFGYGGTGKKSNNRQFDDYGESFILSDTIGCYLDLDARQIFWSKNGEVLVLTGSTIGKVFPKAFDIPRQLENVALFPAVVLKNAEMKFNFGAAPFRFPPGDGFKGLTSAPADFVVNSELHGTSAHTSSKPKPNAPMCIIIEPSRELAEQTYAQMEKFKKHLDTPKVRNLLIIGGVAARDQIASINAGVDIITATPGRLEEFISTGTLCLSQVRFFILDEADGLLSQGYLSLINKIHQQIPKITPDGKRLQMVVCSATLHNFDVKKLADSIMHFPQWVDLKGEDTVPETVHHCVVIVDPKNDKRWINLRTHIQTDAVHARDQLRPGSNTAETLSEAVKLLKGEYVLKAVEEHRMYEASALIFCRTKLDCDNLETYLNQAGKGKYSCVCVHSDRKPEERKYNLQLFKDKKAKFLICTDVAARGLDITGLPFVVNVTLPDEKANYLHRIGRVGRAERMGLAISLVSAVPEKVWYHQCPSKGKSCSNTTLTDHGGCTIWYNETQLLSEIEDSLNITITQVEPDIKVPINEYDGKVVYGQKRLQTGMFGLPDDGRLSSGYEGHAKMLAPTVKELADLETAAQKSYWNLKSFQVK